MNDDNQHPAPPADLPPEEHKKALALEEARRLERIKESVCGSHKTAGSADLPKVHSDESDGL